VSSTTKAPLRVAVIGAGGMGAFHAHTLAAHPDVDLVRVVDPVAERAEAVAAATGSIAGTDPTEAAASPDSDAIVIASPDDTHGELALAALGVGKFVLCEKPLATTVDDAQRVLDAEVAIGSRRLQLGLMREYDPAHLQVRDALREIGAPHFMRCVHRNTNGEWARPLDVVIGQSAVHDLHTVRWLSGEEIVAVSGFGTPRPGGWQQVTIVCELASGWHAVVEFDDDNYAYEVSVEVAGPGGRAVSGRPTTATIGRSGSASQHIGDDWFGRFADAYRIEVGAWVRSIGNDGCSTGPSAWDGVVVQRVVQAAVEAVESGQRIEVAAGVCPALYS